jgi:hypothetical protein
MLASIHPLGERARGNRWGITFSAHLLASAVAGALLGAAFGTLGGAAHHWLGPVPALTVAIAACAAGIAFELGAGGLAVPTVHRQVDRAWLDRYRGWVYGAGFGFQLGLGVATIVTTAAVYLTFVLALVQASLLGGAVVGATFGAVRAATLIAAASVRQPGQLHVLHQALDRWKPRMRRSVVGVEGLAAMAALLAVAGAAG